MVSNTENNKNHMDFHIHLPHLHFHHDHNGGHCKRLEEFKDKDIPKGSLAILVGLKGEEQQRFVIPVDFINHPLFMQLLKEAEEEFGFDRDGPITIPCHVEEFLDVQDLIDKEKTAHHEHHHVWCFGSN